MLEVSGESHIRMCNRNLLCVILLSALSQKFLLKFLKSSSDWLILGKCGETVYNVIFGSFDDLSDLKDEITEMLKTSLCALHLISLLFEILKRSHL